MNIPYIRAPHTEGVSHPVVPSNSPNAALLIDFDNVTMGMRSDLSKELKTLLQSDVIRGKVTVQRAYADWRRYPQYIVPLSEASVDLIFAPAYGSSKKNATDIRMAIDGMELVFTRPEIGTYILLTGDSDFSSLVLKLKEYGKYVIGVGIQESSSDILVQNCDEYYSYTTLSGLRKAGSGEALSQQDPWTLVQRAVEQMTKRRDVMRSDRLKQVMLDLDSTFDEKAIGFSKFSRFLTEAAQKGLLELKKLDNGQYEVSNGRSSASSTSSSSPSTGSGSGRRDRDGRDSRGGRGRDRDTPRRDRSEPTDAPEPTTASAAPETAAAEGAPAAGSASQPTAGTDGSDPQTAKLRAAYELMVQAINDLADAEGEAVRDSDVKRRMLAIQSNFDESELGFGKFSLFLKQADEHEVIELTRGENGIYEVKVSKGADALPASDSGTSAPTRDDDRDQDRDRGRDQGRGRDARKDAPKTGGAAPKPEAPEDTEGRRLRPRLSARRRGASDEPPPLLEGQAVTVPGGSSSRDSGPGSTPDGAVETAEAGEGQKDTAAGRKGRAPRGRGKKDAAPDGKPAGRAASKPAGKGAPKTSTRPASDLPQLGLPSDSESIRQYLMNSYKGVGKKTADMLVEAHEDNLFEVMESQPDMIRSLLPTARAEKLLEQWVDDVARRRAEAHGPAGRPAPEATPRRRSTGGGRRRGSGGRSSR